MKTIFVTSLLFLGIAFADLGCAAIAPGADPVVVNAERATASAVDIIDAFLHLEYDNRPMLEKLSPEIHGAAEILRVQAPSAITTARNLTKAYKQNRSADNKASLATAIAVLQQSAQEAQKYLVQINASKGK